jgi:hypothetical protein
MNEHTQSCTLRMSTQSGAIPSLPLELAFGEPSPMQPRFISLHFKTFQSSVFQKSLKLLLEIYYRTTFAQDDFENG